MILQTIESIPPTNSEAMSSIFPLLMLYQDTKTIPYIRECTRLLVQQRAVDIVFPRMIILTGVQVH